MKAFFLKITILACVQVAFAQDITSTLGASGTFIVEDNTNKSLFRASRNGTPEIVMGDYENGFNLPEGSVNFVRDNGSEKLNLVVGKSVAFSAFPKLQFFYTPGSLTAPADVSDSNLLGIISFFGYNNGWTSSSPAVRIESKVDGAPGPSVPGLLEISTQNNNANLNFMEFNSVGDFELNPNGSGNNTTISGVSGQLTLENLAGTGFSALQVNSTGTVSRGVSSGTLKLNVTEVSSPIYTISDTDHTIIVAANSTLTLPDASSNIGQVYVIKSSGLFALIVDCSSSDTIEGSASIAIGALVPWNYIEVQAISGSWIILSSKGVL
jgi:hypothetical protein